MHQLRLETLRAGVGWVYGDGTGRILEDRPDGTTVTLKEVDGTVLARSISEIRFAERLLVLKGSIPRGSIDVG